MEFLKELSELQEMYYPTDNIKQIGRHLEMDASGIWWRVIRNQISTFDEFKEAFTQKYWGQERQDNIRDHLEYGMFDWRGQISAIPVSYTHLDVYKRQREKLIKTDCPPRDGRSLIMFSSVS